MAFFDTASSLLQITITDIALSADNALIIAVICQRLPSHIRKISIAFGVIFAIVVRVVLTIFAAHLIQIPIVQGLAGIALCIIALQLITAEHKKEATNVVPRENFFSAVGMIIMVDIVMSLDNVMSIAAIAHNNQMLLIFGLVLSIPLVALSSQFFLQLIQRFPYIIDAGAAILGYVGGQLIMTDPFVLQAKIMPTSKMTLFLCSIFSGALVVLLGKCIQRYQKYQRYQKKSHSP